MKALAERTARATGQSGNPTAAVQAQTSKAVSAIEPVSAIPYSVERARALT